MKNTAKQVRTLILKNWSTFLWFEIPYKIIGYSLIYPALQDLFNRILKSTGAPYISQENIGTLFSAPVPVLLLLAAFVLFSYYVYFEITALVIYCSLGWRGQYVSVIGLWRQAFIRSLRIFHYKNLLVFLLFLPLLALSVFRFASSALSAFRIPEFIMDFIWEDSVLAALLVLGALLVDVIVFLCIFSIPFIILKKKNFIGAWRSSLHLLKGRIRKTLFTFMLCFIVYLLIVAIAALIAVLLIFSYSKLFFATGEGQRAAFLFECRNWGRIGGALLRSFTSVGVVAVIIMLYYRYMADPVPVPEKNKLTFFYFQKRLVTVVCCFILIVIYSESEVSGLPLFSHGYSAKIIAHRAGAAFAPENTVAALENAISENADMAEIDVQQTCDGVLIAMHDSNLKRTAGLDRSVRDTSYSTVRTLDAGAWYSYQYSGEKVPTLEEMLQTAQNRIGMMIELKADGNVSAVAEKTIELVDQYHMQSQCMIVSMSLDLLKQVKSLAPEIRTAYITTMLLSDRYDLDSVDAYSVETTFLSAQMLAQAHFQGKEVYAWTPNSERTIKKALRSNADGIITDNPPLAQYCINDTGEASLLNFVVQVFYD